MTHSQSVFLALNERSVLCTLTLMADSGVLGDTSKTL